MMSKEANASTAGRRAPPAGRHVPTDAPGSMQQEGM